MKLLPIPGAPGYRIDCENHKVYSVKNGCVKMMKPSVTYNEVHLYIEGQTWCRSVPRLEYCAINGVDHRKLTKDACIVYDERTGKPVVRTRAEIQRARNTAIRMRPSLEEAERTVAALRRYVEGDKRDYVRICCEARQKAVDYVRSRHNRKLCIIEEASDKALDNLFTCADNGQCITDPFRYVRKYIYAFLELYRKKRKQFRDDMQPMEI